MKRDDYIVAYLSILLLALVAAFSIAFPIVNNNVAMTLLLGSALVVALLMI